MKQYCRVLSIAGSDCSGGAGIQADIKTISAIGCYAASVITVLTAQNTTGVTEIYKISSTFVESQLNAIFEDIQVDAVKIGMLYSKPIVDVVSAAIKKWKPPFVVLDPVMISKSGVKLIQDNTVEQIKKALFPLATLITPNIHEAECLAGTTIKNKQDAKNAAKMIGQEYKTNTLVKGGHLEDNENSTDTLYHYLENKFYRYQHKRINTNNTHGTGCTYSSAITSYLATGLTLPDSVDAAKKYISLAIDSGAQYQLGKGFGPVDHFFEN